MEMTCKCAVLALIHLTVLADGNDLLPTEKQEFVKADAGGSVKISCSFTIDSRSFSVTWSLGCENKTDLMKHPSYKHRVRSENGNLKLIIANLTESDSGTYCCHVEFAGSTMKQIPAARVEVTQPQKKKVPDGITENPCVILYGIVGLEAGIIILLVAVIVKYLLQGLTDTKCKEREENKDEPIIHYAEICSGNLSSHPQIRKEENITYASVMVHK